MTDVAVIDTQPLEAIAGHKLSSAEWLAFEKHSEGTSNKDICAELGMQLWTLTLWQKQEWWVELHQHFFDSAQKQLLAKIISHDEALAETYGEIVKGEHIESPGAASVVNALTQRLKVGKDPLLQTKNIHEHTTTNTQNNYYGIDQKKMELCNQEELLEMNASGDWSRIMKDTNDPSD